MYFYVFRSVVFRGEDGNGRRHFQAGDVIYVLCEAGGQMHMVKMADFNRHLRRCRTLRQIQERLFLPVHLPTCQPEDWD